MVDSQGGEGAGNGSLDMSRNTCSNERCENSSKLSNPPSWFHLDKFD